MKTLLSFCGLIIAIFISCSDTNTIVQPVGNESKNIMNTKPIIILEFKGKIKFDGTVYESFEKPTRLVIPEKYLKVSSTSTVLNKIPEMDMRYMILYSGGNNFISFYPGSYASFYAVNMIVNSWSYEDPRIYSSVTARMEHFDEIYLPSFYSNFTDGSDNYLSSDLNRTYISGTGSGTQWIQYLGGDFTWAWHYTFTNSNIDYGHVFIDCSNMDAGLLLLVNEVVFRFRGINLY